MRRFSFFCVNTCADFLHSRVCGAVPVFAIHTREPRIGLMKPSRVNEMSKQAKITSASLKDAASAFLTGPRREGGRAAEHPQLSPDHA